MNDKIKKRLELINTENNIWILYLVIIGLSFYANEKEKNYFLTNNNQDKNTYRIINAIIFIILIGVYIYFEKEAINSLNNKQKTTKQQQLDILSFIATSAVLLSGIIFLYIILIDEDISEEIAFN